MRVVRRSGEGPPRDEPKAAAPDADDDAFPDSDERFYTWHSNVC